MYTFVVIYLIIFYVKVSNIISIYIYIYFFIEIINIRIQIILVNETSTRNNCKSTIDKNNQIQVEQI